MNGYTTKPGRPAGVSHRCNHGYHDTCERPTCTCPCHSTDAPTKTGLPTPDKAT